ncbi:MAG: glycosyltransferase [Candidatus Eisenbacteria bacterium]|nr:glycosyltransferase [Candidatus Eisenbacteria bacterium]
MTRILIVKPTLPYPPDQGTKIVTFNLLKLLSTHFEVSLVCGLLNRDDESKAENLRPYCKNVFTFLLPNRKSLAHSAYYKALYKTKTFLTGFPLEAYYCSSPELSRMVARVTRSSEYDVALFEYWFTANAARFAEVPCRVLLEHDVDFLRLQRRLTVTRGFWKKRSMERTLSTVRNREVRAYSEFDRVLALSGTDSVLVEKLAGIRGVSEQLPVMVDCRKYLPRHEGKIPSSIVFLGALDADFNVDALEFFCREIFPRVRAEVSGARLFIVGRRPPVSVQKLADGERIVLSADVPDIAPYVGRCMVQVVPLRFGGGVRIRTLEGMAMGMPVVSTTIGADGITAVPGRDLLLADTPRDFAAGVCEILRSPLLGRRLGERAREFVVGEHSERVVETRVVEIFQRLAEQAKQKREYISRRAEEVAR